MFSLEVLIAFPEQIDSMKSDLTKYLPHIKSSHRVEALARALGFKTYASLRAIDLFGEPIRVEINWVAFSDYLKEKGFSTPARPLYLAAARACIRLTMGFHDYQSLAHQVYAERHQKKLEDVLSDTFAEEYLRAYSFVSRIPHTRTITKKRNTNNLKQISEKVSFVYPDGQLSPPSYVTLGGLALAAVGAGFWYRPLEGKLETVHFNMLQRAIDDFERKITLI